MSTQLCVDAGVFMCAFDFAVRFMYKCDPHIRTLSLFSPFLSPYSVPPSPLIPSCFPLLLPFPLPSPLSWQVDGQWVNIIKELADVSQLEPILIKKMFVNISKEFVPVEALLKELVKQRPLKLPDAMENCRLCQVREMENDSAVFSLKYSRHVGFASLQYLWSFDVGN